MQSGNLNTTKRPIKTKPRTATEWLRLAEEGAEIAVNLDGPMYREFKTIAGFLRNAERKIAKAKRGNRYFNDQAAWRGALIRCFADFGVTGCTLHPAQDVTTSLLGLISQETRPMERMILEGINEYLRVKRGLWAKPLIADTAA